MRRIGETSNSPSLPGWVGTSTFCTCGSSRRGSTTRSATRIFGGRRPCCRWPSWRWSGSCLSFRSRSGSTSSGRQRSCYRGTRRGTIRATTSRARLSFCLQGTKYPAHLEAAVAGRPRMRGRRTAVEGATAVRLPTGRRLTRTSSRLLQANPLPRARPLQPRTRLLQAGPAKHLSMRQGQIGAGPPAARCCGNDRVEGATAAVRKRLRATLSVYRIRP
mmetsp:Transcript_4337/g.9381  ORF Transcript_4337/g.9381 Transcript_4337/m.9381 type:complete len:218 (+) Transcript_4337:517-1170(+)